LDIEGESQEKLNEETEEEKSEDRSCSEKFTSKSRKSVESETAAAIPAVAAFKSGTS
jgi:hypothetical protein